MGTTTRLAVLAAIAVGALAPAAWSAPGDCRLIRGAQTTDPADDVSVCRQDTWIHQADTKVGNLVGFGLGGYPSWNTTKPTTSAGGGAGGGYITNSLFHQVVSPQDPRGSAVFQGTYTGNLDNAAVELYAFVAAGVFTRDLNLALTIDGVPIYAGNSIVNMTPGGQAVQKLKFAFTNLYSALSVEGKQGDATTVHTIRLEANGRYVVNDPIVFVYDAAEAPSGIVFNNETPELASYTIIDTAPVEE